jgi:uncharacterized membrane protein YfcA
MVLTFIIGIIAFAYAIIGHAGATGYIAVMTLFGISAEMIRPVALSLNIVVGLITAIQFTRAGFVRFELIVPLVCGSIPAALVGGWLLPPLPLVEALVGCVLVLSAIGVGRVEEGKGSATNSTRMSSKSALFFLGVILGFLSGLTGVGGGVFLTPTLLAIKLTDVKRVAATSAVFILVNSVAGLTGWMAAGNTFPEFSPRYVVVVIAGGLLGSYLGAFYLPPRILRRCMAGVLVLAGVKLLLHATVESGLGSGLV